jgi:hypothetical protein
VRPAHRALKTVVELDGEKPLLDLAASSAAYGGFAGRFYRRLIEPLATPARKPY